MPLESTKLLIAAHKPAWMPEDSVYLPVQVNAGAASPIPGYQPDNEGENISSLNPRYCELTALYWGWKNLDCEYMGLVHYRRYLAGHGERGTASSEDIANLLAKAPVVLPKPRNYLVVDVKTHYSKTFDGRHLDIARSVLREREPGYLDAFDAHMKERKAHICNMLIMRRDYLDSYLSWLFPILQEIESQIDFRNMTPFEARVIGRVSERLLDPWLMENGISYVECPTVDIDGTNWPKKVVGVARALLAGKKYDKSF